MRTRYYFDDFSYNTGTDSAGIMLSNKLGSYFMDNVDSKYRGLYFNINNEMFKIIDKLRYDKDIDHMKIGFDDVTFTRGDKEESLFMPIGVNSLVIETNNEEFLDIILDVKKAYDDREWGRNYDIFVEREKIIVKFTKTTSLKEDSTDNKKEYELYMVIDSNHPIEYHEVKEWLEEQYGLDSKRGDNPRRYVFNAMKIKTKTIVITAGFDKNKAISDADYVLQNIDTLRELSHDRLGPDLDIDDDRIKAAFEFSKNSVNMLSNDIKKGIYAGFPWFFQFWSRDEMISLKPLILAGKYGLVKDLLMNRLEQIDGKGRLPNRWPETVTGSADGIGWYAARWSDFFKELSLKKKLKDVISKEEIIDVSFRLKDSYKEIMNNFFQQGLFFNDAQETWMDSVWEGDNRKGYRIEVQAMMLGYLELLAKILGNRDYLEKAKKIKENVRKHFFKNGYLYDGKDDSTIRPNIFIAAYIYPGLLTVEEWKQCFRIVLPKLWLDFGGLATIDKSNPLFCSENTGVSTKSYHRGDSWYWINNLAAIVLHKIGGEEFKGYVDKILEASTKEILEKGLLGNHAEITSASRLDSEGCLMQAWSSAMYVELICELFG